MPIWVLSIWHGCITRSRAVKGCLIQAGPLPVFDAGRAAKWINDHKLGPPATELRRMNRMAERIARKAEPPLLKHEPAGDDANVH